MSPVSQWANPLFRQCSFWGDPHFTKSFFGRRFDYQGIGIFNVASSKDGSFLLQNFQCAYANNPRVSVAIGFAMKVDGKTTFISRQSTVVASEDKCTRLEVRTRHTGRSPGFYHDISLAVEKSRVSNEGICGHAPPHNDVSCDETMLFTQEQINQLCQSCTHPKPRHCTQRCVQPTPAPPPTPPTPPPCDNMRAAQKKCCVLEDDFDYESCILDYCAAGGEEGEEMADNAIEESEHPERTCQLADSATGRRLQCLPKETMPQGRCKALGLY